MSPKKYLALLTDFGSTDHYVAVIKGILYRLVPDLVIIDISHSVSPFSPLQANFFIEQTLEYLPDDCCGLVVVDPTVGGPRRIVLVKLGEQYWLGPDNGCLRVLIDNPLSSVRCLPEEMPFWPEQRSTFEARDRMAPFMGRLLAGHPVDSLTLPVQKSELSTLQYRCAISSRNKVAGRILHIDHFGNVITSIKVLDQSDDIRKWRLLHGQQVFSLWVDSYDEIHDGAALIAGSHGYIEICCRQAAAAERYQISVGDEVILLVHSDGETHE